MTLEQLSVQIFASAFCYVAAISTLTVLCLKFIMLIQKIPPAQMDQYLTTLPPLPRILFIAFSGVGFAKRFQSVTWWNFFPLHITYASLLLLVINTGEIAFRGQLLFKEADQIITLLRLFGAGLALLGVGFVSGLLRQERRKALKAKETLTQEN